MLILTQKCHANPSDLDQTHMIHSCTRVCVENILLLMSAYKNIQHILIAIHLYTFWKRKTHFHAQSVASNFTPNLYPKHFAITNYLHTFEVHHTNFYCFSHIYLYAYRKANYILHTFAFKRAFHAIIHSFRKTIYSYLARNFMPLIFTHISTHHWKAFPTLLRCKVPIMGQPKFLQTSPYFHAFLILKPNFGFPAISMFPCIEATSLGS